MEPIGLRERKHISMVTRYTVTNKRVLGINNADVEQDR